MPSQTQPGKLKSTDKEQVVKLYESGWSIRFISKFYGVSYSTVWYHLSREGVEMRPRSKGAAESRLSHEEMDRTVFLFKDLSLSIPEIAEITGVQPGTVRRRLQRAGVLELDRKKSVTQIKWHRRKRRQEARSKALA